MNVLQTVAVFVVAPAVIYGLIALLTLVPARRRKNPKYRAGQSWDYPDQWWAGDLPVAAGAGGGSAEREGGARGTW